MPPLKTLTVALPIAPEQIVGDVFTVAVIGGGSVKVTDAVLTQPLLSVTVAT